jgi:hypothetical protein
VRDDVLDQLIFPGGVPSRVAKDQRQGVKAPVAEGPPEWAKHPKTIGGNEFFYVSALAQALNRSVKAIYKWEDNGWLPESRYRTTAKHSSLPGKAEAGRRLYTREQIEAVVDAAKQTGVYDLNRKTPPDWAKFTRLVVEAWTRR